MNLREKDITQTELNSLLYDLSSASLPNEKKTVFIKRFENIYCNKEFRHMYSNFFPIISTMAINDNYDLEILINNLNEIRIFAAETNNIVSKNLEKLFDHINLEISRYNTYTTEENKQLDLEKQLSNITEEFGTAQMKLEKANKKTASLQTEMITVLSVFSAIVITFSGGINFLGSSFASLSTIPLMKAIIFAIVCGIILFNTIFLLIYLIGKITERNIYAKCITAECTCKNKCNSIQRIIKRLPYVFWFNILMFALLIIAIVTYPISSHLF